MKFSDRIKISLLVRPPKWVRQLFRKTLWRVDTQEKSLYLTFDDGPVPGLTPWILETLKIHHAKATFFCVGDNVRRNPIEYQKILDAGHAVGNHTYSHLNGYKSSIRKYILDVYRAKKYIRSDLFRPPYGKARPLARRILLTRFRFVQWDVLSLDYDSSLDPRQVMRNITESAGPGSIVVLHDNFKAEKNLRYVLPKVLGYYSRRNYRFLPLSADIRPIKNRS